ncbi:MAG: c-type cytochrome [Candidatus Acidiferrales bacterium]
MTYLNPATRWAAPIALLAIACIFAPAHTADAQHPGDSQNGKKVFEKLGCLACHGSSGEGMPSTGGQPGTPKIAATHLSLSEFVHSVRQPKGEMPPFDATLVSDTELSDVYSFLQSLASQPKLELPSSANGQNGQHLYTTFGCYECHGYQGQGSTQTGGTRLGPPQIPYSGFVAYVRQPTGQMPPYTLKAITDAQLADIYAFLQTRPPAAPSKSIPLLNK